MVELDVARSDDTYELRLELSGFCITRLDQIVNVYKNLIWE
jgi:hypothetical protein